MTDDVQGRRGITDFVVKCDESNNTGEIIDRNEFVVDIFVKHWDWVNGKVPTPKS
jgi:hypothetical protein